MRAEKLPRERQDDIGFGLGKVLKTTGQRPRSFSKRGGARRLDLRSAEGRYMRRMREMLTAHVGGKPSTVQIVIIERLCWLALHLAKIDMRAVETGGMSDYARREYLAWSGHYARLIASLGMQGQDDKTPKPPSLDDVVEAGRGNGNGRR